MRVFFPGLAAVIGWLGVIVFFHRSAELYPGEEPPRRPVSGLILEPPAPTPDLHLTAQALIAFTSPNPGVGISVSDTPAPPKLAFDSPASGYAQNPLIVAASSGDLRLSRKLLDDGSDPNGAAPGGITPLMAAAQAGSIRLIEELIRRGANLNAVDADGRTALMHAISAHKVAAAQTLFDHWPDLSIQDHAGRDALGCALSVLGDGPLTRSILAASPRRSTWTTPAREALFGAIRLRDAQGVRLYLEKHAEPPTLGQGRQSLLAYVIAWKDLPQLRFLLAAGADPNHVLTFPVEKEFVALFSGKLMPHYLSEEPGLTPLMLAAGLGRPEFVKALMEHGARPGAVTEKHKIAALSFAAWVRDVPSQLVLLGKPPRLDEQPMRIRISLNDQRAYVYRGREIALTTAISTGRSGFPTPTGDYVVTDKHFKRMSTLYKVPMPFFMRLSCSEVGMHAGVVPGYPASHGCIRMPREIAQRLFQTVQIGTPVSIVN